MFVGELEYGSWQLLVVVRLGDAGDRCVVEGHVARTADIWEDDGRSFQSCGCHLSSRNFRTSDATRRESTAKSNQQIPIVPGSLHTQENLSVAPHDNHATCHATRHSALRDATDDTRHATRDATRQTRPHKTTRGTRHVHPARHVAHDPRQHVSLTSYVSLHRKLGLRLSGRLVCDPNLHPVAVSGAGNVFDGWHKRKAALPPPRFTFIELFAGVGGFRLGLEALGGRCVFACEIMKSVRETYVRNFGSVDGASPLGDVRKIDTADVPPFDVLTAGFPCQSYTGLTPNAQGLHCDKGQLVFEVVRFLRQCRSSL